MKKSEGGPRKRNSALAVLELFRQAHPSATTLHMAIYLYVAENPGISLIEVSFLTRTSLSTSGRSVRGLLDAADPMALKPCFGLIKLKLNPLDGRSKVAFLTEKGLELGVSINDKIALATPVKMEGHKATVMQ